MKNKWLILYTLSILTLSILGLNIFADIKEDKPDQTIYLSKNTNTMNIFDEKFLWYPGCPSQTKILRIFNDNRFSVDIVNIYLENIKLYYEEEGIKKLINSTDEKYLSYIKNMKLDIYYENKYLNLLRNKFTKDSYSFENFKDGIDTDIKVNKNNYIDLIYIISMDKSAPNNIQGITAYADLKVHTRENTTSKSRNLVEQKTTNNFGFDYQKSNESDLKSHWSYNCLASLLNNKIIEGYSDGSIRPNNYITRAEAAVLIAKTLKIKQEFVSEKIYNDNIPTWAEGYIYALTKKDVFDGYEDKTFRPNKYISREEMTSVLVRAFNKKYDKKVDIKFDDKHQISNWAVGYINAGVQNKIIDGYEDNTFRPKDNIKRSETFIIICKLLNLHNHGTAKEN